MARQQRNYIFPNSSSAARARSEARRLGLYAPYITDKPMNMVGVEVPVVGDPTALDSFDGSVTRLGGRRSQ